MKKKKENEINETNRKFRTRHIKWFSLAGHDVVHSPQYSMQSYPALTSCSKKNETNYNLKYIFNTSTKYHSLN